MPNPEYDCQCGHPFRSHEPGINLFNNQPDGTPICGEDGCYCGRNPLEWAQVVGCEWCTGGSSIVWCRTSKGRMMPVEPEPNPAGNCSIDFTKGVPMVTVHKGPPGMFDEWTPYMPHHARCDMKLRRKPTQRGNQ